MIKWWNDEISVDMWWFKDIWDLCIEEIAISKFEIVKIERYVEDRVSMIVYGLSS